MARESISQTYSNAFTTFEANARTYDISVTYDWLRWSIAQEASHLPRRNYFSDTQLGAFTEGDRAILVDWFTELALTKRLPLSAVIRATHLMDRYFSDIHAIRDDPVLAQAATQCNNSPYIFVAMICFNIAVKVEGEKSCIPLFLQMYSVDPSLFLDLEAKILQQFRWNVTVPTSLTFLEDCLCMLLQYHFKPELVVTAHAGEYDTPTQSELSTRLHGEVYVRFCRDAVSNLHIINSHAGFLQFSPSIQACAAIYVAACIGIVDKELRSEIVHFLDNLKVHAKQNITAVQKCGQMLHCLIQRNVLPLSESQASGIYASRRVRY
ncbi:putative Cyclin [Giardia muris]|uniref:Putative Cyclin n=1 Tax=Giardia muris TaxID=5742 RepID=A0A4Z1T8K9_GIAMU|nr:putative Cyclin [Giardia muris]|eukprot:TNJ30463.1 putative Cyclin [Giardia muris]